MFNLVSKFEPKGDQIKAIEQLKDNFDKGIKEQVLLGATGTGKTYTIANIIANVNKRTLVLAPNKTLAGQLFGEIKSFFPNDHVEYFISYYDYYQPEAYIASKDMHIDKDCAINEEIDQLRHSAVDSILTYENTIVVASVSCIYGMGDVEDYKKSMFHLRVNDTITRSTLLNKLVSMQYHRNSMEFDRGNFRVKGDIVDIRLISTFDKAIRLSFFGDSLESIKYIDPITGHTIESVKTVTLFPATLFATDADRMEESTKRIRQEMKEQVKLFTDQKKLIEAQRIEERTAYDLEMLEEVGYVKGVENYSRHMALRGEGDTPSTLVDFFGRDFLMIIDESHVTVPQIHGMYKGDRSRKESLVNYGWRLPSAMDNRPLKYDEFDEKIDKVIFMSATPGNYELDNKFPVTEQIIRPTYLLDPTLEVRYEIKEDSSWTPPTIDEHSEILVGYKERMIDNLWNEIKERVNNKERVLITTLTIKMSEELTDYFKKAGLKVAYLHSKVKSLDRMKILQELRLGIYDCLIGINLLREGLDLPEVSLVVILDADKQGFLRSKTSLIQTIGRAARNLNGKVIMYADAVSESMDFAIKETFRRRKIQELFNIDNNVVPFSIKKDIQDLISNLSTPSSDNTKAGKKDALEKQITAYEKDMRKAATELDFERAAQIRDILFELKKTQNLKK